MSAASCTEMCQFRLVEASHALNDHCPHYWQRQQQLHHSLLDARERRHERALVEQALFLSSACYSRLQRAVVAVPLRERPFVLPMFIRRGAMRAYEPCTGWNGRGRSVGDATVTGYGFINNGCISTIRVEILCFLTLDPDARATTARQSHTAEPCDLTTGPDVSLVTR